MRKTDWLQLFAQPEEPAQAGENAGDTAPDAGERQEDFEDLIRGRYKVDFEARVRKILDGRLRGLRQEVAQLRQWERERDLRHQAAMGRLSRQEPEIQRVYPEFRWQREMDDPGFARLIDAGVEPREAYEMVHRRELTASGGQRVRENTGHSASVSRPDPGKLTSQELADIRRRVMDGEKISF